jgi:hypothetical protein
MLSPERHPPETVGERSTCTPASDLSATNFPDEVVVNVLSVDP